jgi:diguanylate cyclase (GGDEF)-like protein
VTFPRDLLPAGPLTRIRLAALVIGELALLAQMTQVGNDSKTVAYNGLSVAAILLLAAMLLVTYVRTRAQWWDLITMPPLLVLGGSGLTDPLATMALALAVMVTLSLYGPTWTWLVRTIGGIAAVPVAVHISPISMNRELAWNSPAVLTILPQLLLLSAMMRGIYAALLRQERASGREAVLARAGRQMLGAADIGEVRRHAVAAANDLVALSPGVVVVSIRDTPQGRQISHAIGRPDNLRGTPVPDDVLTDQSSLRALLPGMSHWRGDTVAGALHMLVGSVRPVADDVFDAFVNLSHQVALAEASQASHDELDHRANHDQLTQLPTRAKFFRALADAVDSREPGTVALLNIDLDDFKQVNDLHGHAAGDELLIRVGERIRSVGGPGSVAARFGGDEFALLLTGLSAPVEAEQIAELLCARLVAPIELAAATVTVGASIGVALSAAGRTAGDLTRSADIAMYSAKAQGKNRVEVFHPARHGDAADHRTREKHLAQAIGRGEIEVRYRPQVAPGTGRPVAVEAHTYWRHADFGELGPGELWDLAARTGNLPGLARHALRTICADIAALDEPIRFVMEISGSRLHDPAMAELLHGTLAEHGLDPALVTLRVGGGDPLARPASQLLAAGTQIGLDAAHTRTATMMSLRANPVSTLTVADDDDEGLALALAIGAVLDVGVVVEGVRDPRAHRPAGVVALQGEAVAPEMTAAELAGWLAAPVPA